MSDGEHVTQRLIFYQAHLRKGKTLEQVEQEFEAWQAERRAQGLPVDEEET